MLRRRGRLGHSSNTPLSLTRRRLGLKDPDNRADQPRLPIPPPARTGEAVLKTRMPSNPRKPRQRRYLRRAGMPRFLSKVVPSEEGVGSPAHLFHWPLWLTSTGQPDRPAVTPTEPQGLRPMQPAVRHGAPDILNEPVARRQMCQ